MEKRRLDREVKRLIQAKAPLRRQTIRRAKKKKAAGQDGVPIEPVRICPAACAEHIYELFAADTRIKCVVKN